MRTILISVYCLWESTLLFLATAIWGPFNLVSLSHIYNNWRSWAMPFIVGRLWKTLLISGPASAEGMQLPCSSLMPHGHVKKRQYNGLLDIKGILLKIALSVERSSIKAFPNIIYIAWHTFLNRNILYASLLLVYLQSNVQSPVLSLLLSSSNHPARHNILL